MSILVKNINKTFGKQKALDDVSFEAGTGKIVGFIGPNGAGKTTMMRIITGFIPPDSGEVSVLGNDIFDNSLEVRKLIGYLPENNPLYPEMYVKEYLEFVAGMYKIGNNFRKKVDEAIEMTGLTVEQNKKIGALSKGYRQRVGLAQTIVHNPEVFILDEPTSGLDPNQIIEIRNLIVEIGKQKTILLSTHIMQEVEAICNRVVIINNGRVVADNEVSKVQNLTTDTFSTILVEFDKQVSESNLKNIQGVIKVVKVKENNWLLQSSTSDDIRSAIFNFAVKNSLTVLSLHKQEKSLEEVFHQLTQN